MSLKDKRDPGFQQLETHLAECIIANVLIEPFFAWLRVYAAEVELNSYCDADTHHGMRATLPDSCHGTPGNQSLCLSSSSLQAVLRRLLRLRSAPVPARMQFGWPNTVSTYSESMSRRSPSKEPTPKWRDAPCAAASLHWTF